MIAASRRLHGLEDAGGQTPHRQTYRMTYQRT
jgi:hypothetical protein